MADEENNSFLKWLIAAAVGGLIVYMYLKNKNPTMTLQPQSLQSQQPIINLNLEGLERRFESLEYRMEQLQNVQRYTPGTFLTMSPPPKEPLVTAKVEELKEIKKEEKKSEDIRMKDVFGRDDEPISQGNLKKEKYDNYYDVSSTVTQATAADPLDYNSNVYDVHNIQNVLGRKAPVLYVSNDAGAQETDVLYVVNSHYGGSGGSKEEPVYAHEIKEYHNLYELKVRSPTKDLPYRVTEYKIYKQ